jgi:hypothetical protein
MSTPTLALERRIELDVTAQTAGTLWRDDVAGHLTVRVHNGGGRPRTPPLHGPHAYGFTTHHNPPCRR